MSSIITAIEAHTRNHPDKLLFAFLDIKGNVKESYTYATFEQRTKSIAAYLHARYDLRQGDRVLLAYPPGLEVICAFFACVRLGLIPVPVYPPSANGLEASVQKMSFIARDSGAKAVLTDRSCYWSYKVHSTRNKTEIAALQWIVSEDADPEAPADFPQAHSDILFLQYTSGSTNDPKGVMVTHENIIRNCINVVDHLPIGVSWLPQYHDMGLIGYYLFFALKGGTTYGFSPADFIQRPALWLESISKYRATASSAPNFAYEYCLTPGKIPEETLASLDLSSLTFFMTASEPIKPEVHAAFLEKFRPAGLNPVSFYGAYGLAEFTLAVTNYGRTSTAFDAALLREGKVRALNPSEKTPGITLMSCGIALRDTVIRIVDTAANTPAAEDTVGEIWLDGISKCAGYWNRPDRTKELFEAQIAGENGKWLRTGDSGFLHEGELYVCGRIKDTIILRGLNYYPQDIEGVVGQDPLVRNGCVVAFSVERPGSEALIVVAGLKSRSGIPDAQALQLKIRQYLGISAAEMVFVPARTIPKTSSGKLRRQETKRKYTENELQVLSRVDMNEAEPAETPDSSPASESALLLRRYRLNAQESATLGDAGLDSMKLAEFGHDLKALLERKGFDDLSQEVDLKLLQRIAVSELSVLLEELETASRFARFRFRKAFSGIQTEYEQSESRLMLRDTALSGIEDAVNALPREAVSDGAILLTGGTGFFGPFLIDSLLEQTDDDIYVLVRASSIEEGRKRLSAAFAAIRPSAVSESAFEARVKPVLGDLAQPGLGLSTEDRESLSREIHTIYHNGAYVNYLMDYEAMRQINVNGTKDVIALALASRPKVLNYISTTFIFGWSAKDTLFESDANSAMEFLDFGYSQSKWVADQVVLKALAGGLRGRIFRPALISPSTSGRGYNFDISIRLLSFMLKYGIGTSAQNQVSFTPADLAANNIVAISGIEASEGLTFHVTRDAYSTMQDVTDRLALLSGKSFRNYDLKSFVPEVVGRCEKHDLLFPLLNFLVRSVDNISAMEFKRYDNGNYRKFRSMSAHGKEDPPLEEVVKGIFLFMQHNREIADSLEAAPSPETITNTQ